MVSRNEWRFNERSSERVWKKDQFCIPIAASRIFCDGAFGSGVFFIQYSDNDIYAATPNPTVAANQVELWNIIQVATHNPKYVI